MRSTSVIRIRRTLSCATCRTCLLFIVGTWLISNLPLCVIGKEIELTSEWTHLDQNDTVPAGAHIRMDLSTGERWAKLATITGEEITTTQVEIDSSTGGIVALHNNHHNNDHKHQEQEQSTDKVIAENKQQYDYNMMHRTLSQLPPDEQKRIGGLPQLPQADKIDPETRKKFEKRMEEIWIQRQAELQAIQQEFMADMPKLLLARIRRIDSYLQDPYTHLMEDWNDDDDNDEEKDAAVSHIVSVLLDLEHHLSDVDMTRDFHTLGGWPLLVSLLSDTVHQSVNQTTLSADLEKKVNDIQAHAAWAIGTAVKNMREFFPYAIEEFSIDDGISKTTTTTAIHLLVTLIQNAAAKDDETSSSSKLRKSMYALGALLRGNREAQTLFCALDGPAVLLQLLLRQVAGSSSDPLAKRILALADDIISDVDLHPKEPTMDAFIIDAFSKEDWCQSALMCLEREDDALQETALYTIRTMAPHCQWDKELVRASVTRLKQTWQEEENEEHLEERLQLANSILNQL